MSDWKKITKKEFDNATKRHLPNSWIKFGFKYFSKETTKTNLKLNNRIGLLLIILFVLGFFSTVLKLSSTIIGIFTILYSILLVGLVLYLFSVAILNNIRINKIRKILGVSKLEYNALIRKFNK
jgi:hypothetical protein